MEHDNIINPYLRQKNSQTFEGNLDFLEFADLIYVLLKAAWGEDWGIFSMESPKTLEPKNVTFPAITFQLIEQKPGIVGNNDVRERKPRIRGEYRETNRATGTTRLVNEYGQRFDADIQFSVFAETNLEAIRKSEEFMDFIFKYKGILQKHGIQNIWFQSESEDDDNPRDSVYVRRINYRVVFEKIYPTIMDEQGEISIEVETKLKDLREKEKLPSQERTKQGGL